MRPPVTHNPQQIELKKKKWFCFEHVYACLLLLKKLLLFCFVWMLIGGGQHTFFPSSSSSRSQNHAQNKPRLAGQRLIIRYWNHNKSCFVMILNDDERTTTTLPPVTSYRHLSRDCFFLLILRNFLMANTLHLACPSVCPAAVCLW